MDSECVFKSLKKTIRSIAIVIHLKSNLKLINKVIIINGAIAQWSKKKKP